MSAELFLETIPIRVLFPTPLPANIPILWPLPQVSNPSTALIPKDKGSDITLRSNGLGGGELDTA